MEFFYETSASESGKDNEETGYNEDKQVISEGTVSGEVMINGESTVKYKAWN